MKTTTVLLAFLLLCFAGAVNAQDAFTPSWSAGFDVRGALPMGDFKDAVNFGVGGTGYVAYTVAPQVAITGRTGYVYFGGKEYTFDTGISTITAKTNYGLIPIVAGVKYFFSEGDSRVYIAGETGLFILSASSDIAGSSSTSTSKFGVSPSLGAQFRAGDNMMVDAHANFSNVFTDNTSTNWITFAVGFEWMLK
jgi:roadblock/LC7 domain-containing protein